MAKTNFRGAILAFALSFVLAPVTSSSAGAQESSRGEVGIEEKLGAQAALDVVLKDEEGNDVTMRRLIDRPTILTLNYFNCAGICTPLLHEVVDVVNRIDRSPGRDFQIITLSFDPRDTPEIARAERVNYVNQMKRQFPPSAWRFLTGEAHATKEVADSVGFSFRADGDQYVHPGAIMILTPEGIVSRYIYGASFLPVEVAMAVQDAEGGVVRPTISRILALCYSYDPEARRHVLSLTRVAGAATLVLAGGFVMFLLLQGRNRKKTRLPE